MSELKTIPESSEAEQKFGNNIEVKIYLRRHSKYDRNSKDLTEEGRKMAHNVGEEVTPSGEGNHYLATGYSSEFSRTQQTADEILSAINTDRKGSRKVKLELGSLAEDFYIPDMAVFLESEAGIEVSGVHISRRGLAARVARVFEKVIDMSSRFYTGSRVDLVCVTHLPWILSFLRQLNEKSFQKHRETADFREKIGGEINFIEGFDLMVRRENPAKVALVLSFRGETVEVPYEKIVEIARG